MCLIQQREDFFYDGFTCELIYKISRESYIFQSSMV